MMRDIAFYDASVVGNLISRMTQDSRAMINPLTLLINSVLSNVILLFGGLIMSFVVFPGGILIGDEVPLGNCGDLPWVVVPPKLLLSDAED